VRRRCRETLALLPERLRGIGSEGFDPFPVGVSDGLRDLLDKMTHAHI
jgi:hypothetical protein